LSFGSHFRQPLALANLGGIFCRYRSSTRQRSGDAIPHSKQSRADNKWMHAM
jgi:hypothetical protein